MNTLQYTAARRKCPGPIYWACRLELFSRRVNEIQDMKFNIGTGAFAIIYKGKIQLDILVG